MLNFRDGAPGVFAAGEIAKYYTRQAEGEEQPLADLVAGYYGAHRNGSARDDLDPIIAELVGVDPDRPITNYELSNVIQCRRTDGDRIPGKQEQRATASKGKVTYYDFTLSPPKSASIAWALAQSEREKQIILDAHRFANREAMHYLEDKLGWARRGKAGSKGADKGQLIWWSFEDYVARPVAKIADNSSNSTIVKEVDQDGDMHIHTHNIVPNMVAVVKDGRVEHVGAIDTKRLHSNVKKIGKVYQAFFATKLREHGVDIGLDQRTGMSTIHSIERWVVDLFSKRHTDGEQAAKDYAARMGRDWEKMLPKEKVDLLNQAKAIRRLQKLDDAKAGQEVWEAQAKAAGYEHQSVLRPGHERFLASRKQRLHAAYETSLPRLDEELDRRSVFGGEIAQIAALEGLIEHGIQDPERDVHAITRAYRTEGVQQNGEKTALVWGRVSRKFYNHFTTKKHLQQEQHAISLLREGAQDKSGTLTKATIEREIAAYAASPGGKQLSENQQKMAVLLGTTGRVAVGIGAAGVGKTTILSPLVSAWHAAGYQTVGMTVPWRQAHDLENSGIQRTYSAAAFIHGALSGHVAVDSKTVVVFDELSQASTRMMLDIAELRKTHGFTLIGLGDPLQTNSIQAGATLRMFELVMGEALPELLDTVRQGKQEAEITLKFRSGNPDIVREALDQKLSAGELFLEPGGYNEAIKRTVGLWERLSDSNKDTPSYRLGITVPTNADVLAVGTAIRERLQARGAVHGDARVLDAADQHGTRYQLPIAVGDTVRVFNRVYGRYVRKDGSFTRKARFGDNGSIATIVSIKDDGMFMRSAKGKLAWVPWDELKVPMKTGDLIRLTYGHALTIETRQGDTVTEHIWAMPSGSRAVNALKGYVAASRHTKRSWIVTSQGTEMQELRERRPLGDVRNYITAKDKVQDFVLGNMARNLARQEVKQLAVDFRRTATRIRQGTVKAMKATWHREEPDKPEAPAVQEPAPFRPQADPKVAAWARQIAEGKGYDGMFEDLVTMEYAVRLTRVQSAGITDIDHGAIHDAASDAVLGAIQQHEAELQKEQGRGPDKGSCLER